MMIMLMIICIGFMSLLFTFKGARVQALSSEYKLTSLILEMMIMIMTLIKIMIMILMAIVVTTIMIMAMIIRQ